ncbi:hypothetical protein P8452_46231 [Trifolium repens]|nr:hypothetical protein P8452_46231 [Trifolium repens]
MRVCTFSPRGKPATGNRVSRFRKICSTVFQWQVFPLEKMYTLSFALRRGCDRLIAFCQPPSNTVFYYQVLP